MPRSPTKENGNSIKRIQEKKRGMKLTDGLTVGGKNRLTDKIIDRFQNYFGMAIRSNTGDQDGMLRSIWAVFKHLIRNDDETLESQHFCCPNFSDSWCKFWQSKFIENVSYNDSNRLPNVFLKELEPIFTTLTDKSLLSRCLMGLTQNQNESINAILWKHCPKTWFCGKRRIEIGIFNTIIELNSEATTTAIVYESSGVQPGTVTFTFIKQQ